MAIIKNSILGLVSGKVGSMVVVTRGKTTYVRSIPKYTDQSWSEKQLQVRQRFKAATLFSQKYKKSLIWPVWNLVAGTASGYHKFLGANIHAFDMEGNVKDPSLIRFSAGSLPAPFQSGATRQHGQIRVTWEHEPFLSDPRLRDPMWYMTVTPGDAAAGPVFTGPHKTNFPRKLKEAFISDPDGRIGGLYIFFAGSDRKAFSPDRFIQVAEPPV